MPWWRSMERLGCHHVAPPADAAIVAHAGYRRANDSRLPAAGLTLPPTACAAPRRPVRGATAAAKHRRVTAATARPTLPGAGCPRTRESAAGSPGPPAGHRSPRARWAAASARAVRTVAADMAALHAARRTPCPVRSGRIVRVPAARARHQRLFQPCLSGCHPRAQHPAGCQNRLCRVRRRQQLERFHSTPR